MSSPTPSHAHLVDERLLERAFKRSNALRWNLARESFARALDRSVASRFATEARTAEAVCGYVESLNLEELALACACAEGQVSAWSFFIECYRPGLRAAARVIAGDDEGGELADSIYAELYGLEERDGCRRSLLDYFHGRSRLSTWLRAILAQRYVDRVRAAGKTKPLDEVDEEIPDRRAPATPVDSERTRFARLAQRALASAIRSLEPADRLRFSSYYLQRLTLAQIGRLMGEHEATVSRKLDRIRRDLRSSVERLLREEHHLGERQVQECMDAGLEDVGLEMNELFGGRAGAAGGRQERPPGSF